MLLDLIRRRTSEFSLECGLILVPILKQKVQRKTSENGYRTGNICLNKHNTSDQSITSHYTISRTLSISQTCVYYYFCQYFQFVYDYGDESIRLG